jgi:hypothetical protein
MPYERPTESIEEIDRRERAGKPFVVRGPATPGSTPSAQLASSLESARLLARKFQDRRDLRHQDVRIEWADSGRLIEYAGPG